LHIGGRSLELSDLTLRVEGSAGRATLLAPGAAFRCERLVIGRSGESPPTELSFEEGVCPDDPAGEFIVEGAPYPVVGGEFHVEPKGDDSISIELDGETEEIEFSGCDCIVRPVPFTLKGTARLAASG